MRAFVRMRHYIKYNNQLLPRKYLLLEEKVDNNTKRIDELFDKFNPKVITKNSIFYKMIIIPFCYKKTKKGIIFISNHVIGNRS